MIKLFRLILFLINKKNYRQNYKNWSNKSTKLKKYSPIFVGLILTPIIFIIFKKFKAIYYFLLIYCIFFNSTTKK